MVVSCRAGAGKARCAMSEKKHTKAQRDFLARLKSGHRAFACDNGGALLTLGDAPVMRVRARTIEPLFIAGLLRTGYPRSDEIFLTAKDDQ